MSRLEVRNRTRAVVGVAPYFDRLGDVVQVVIVKQAFAVDPVGRVVPTTGAEILHADVPWFPDRPERSSVRYPSDFCTHKPSTDVVLVGCAVAPRRKASTSIDVRLRVGPLQVALRAYGPRPWVRGLTGLDAGPAEPTTEVPLRWELAWGGSDFSDPRRPVEEPRNPVGRGVGRRPDSPDSHLGFQIEFIDRPEGLGLGAAPAGVGAIGSNWAPRRDLAGTFDARWMAERMPLPPVDQDERFHQVAPPWMIAPSRLVGGEPVELSGVHPDGPLAFALPRWAIAATARRDRGEVSHAAVLDTVIIEPNQRRLELVWRLTLRERDPLGALRAVGIEERTGGGRGAG
jgi:hypothetical protein